LPSLCEDLEEANGLAPGQLEDVWNNGLGPTRGPHAAVVGAVLLHRRLEAAETPAEAASVK